MGAVATAGAAWFAATIAYRGLEKWRSETLGKRKADVATSALASVYRAEEIFRSARSSFVLPHEYSEREGVPKELATNANYAPEARLLEHEAFFSSMVSGPRWRVSLRVLASFSSCG